MSSRSSKLPPQRWHHPPPLLPFDYGGHFFHVFDLCGLWDRLGKWKYQLHGLFETYQTHVLDRQSRTKHFYNLKRIFFINERFCFNKIVFDRLYLRAYSYFENMYVKHQHVHYSYATHEAIRNLYIWWFNLPIQEIQEDNTFLIFQKFILCR